MKNFLFILIYGIVISYTLTSRTRRLEWDIFGYYLYLPATFIYHDLTLDKKEQWLNPLIDKYALTDGFYQANKGPRNQYVMKYTMGLSIVFSPFFFAANFIAPHLGYEQDGFSPPYQYSMMLCSLLFTLIGLWFFLKILNRYFNSNFSLLIVSLIVYGTNYFMMTAHDGLMPHNFVFTFFAIMLYYTIKWQGEQKIKYAVAMGICFGMATLIRPTSCVVALVPLLWNVGSVAGLKARVALLNRNKIQVLLLAASALAVLFPQFSYWHSLTGSWLFYSYPGEKLNFATPHLFPVLFSFKKGWLLYTPLICVAIAGFYFLFKKQKQLFAPLFIFFLINTYVISCWDCWWYGGSFAQRPFVESYVFMAFPLAAIVSEMCAKQKYLLIPFALLVSFFVFLNLFQTHQAFLGVINTERTTKEYYWRTFFKTILPEEDKRWLEPKLVQNERVSLPKGATPITVFSDSMKLTPKDCYLSAEHNFSRKFNLPQNYDFDVQDYYLLSTITIDTAASYTSQNLQASLVVCILKNYNTYEYRSVDFTLNDLKQHHGQAELLVLLPPQANKKNYKIETYVYFSGAYKLKLKSLAGKLFRLK